jgi:hypothetical protein
MADYLHGWVIIPEADLDDFQAILGDYVVDIKPCPREPGLLELTISYLEEDLVSVLEDEFGRWIWGLHPDVEIHY